MELQYICTLFDWKPRYHQFGVYCCIHGEHDIAGEKLGRIWKFWFYLSCVRMQWVATQTVQSTHALPPFSKYLGSIEWESAPLCPLSRTIVPNLILAPAPTTEKSRQIYKAPTKWSAYWHSTRRKSTPIAPVVSWQRNIKSCHAPQIGLVPIYIHTDIEDRVGDEIWLLIFQTASAFCDCHAPELNNTIILPPHGCTKSAFYVIKCEQSPTNPTLLLHLYVIVAVVEAEVPAYVVSSLSNSGEF